VKIREAYLEKFFNEKNGKCDPGTQTSQAFALYVGLVPEYKKNLALEYLEKRILEDNKGHLSTGIMGTPFMLDVLCRNNRAAIAYNVANKKTFPGWGFMLNNNATTLWEHWDFSDNTYSHNHPMFGSVSQWFFNWLGGIQPAPDAVGFDKIVFRPQLIEDLRWVKSGYKSIRGQITCNWQKENDKIKFRIEVPVNAQAEFHMPVVKGHRVFESGAPVTDSGSIQIVTQSESHIIFHLVSGTYHFEVQRNDL
jgi:alpha-L-rhamnosidase